MYMSFISNVHVSDSDNEINTTGLLFSVYSSFLVYDFLLNCTVFNYICIFFFVSEKRKLNKRQDSL